jgi:hypothetical protein
MTIQVRPDLDELDELRCRDTIWLRARRAELVRIQRQARAEELAIVGVLDERGALDSDVAGSMGVSARVERDTLDTARALGSLPAIAAVARDGRLSDEQLVAVAQLADSSTDREWAERAPDCSPSELQRMARAQRTPTAEESMVRHRARSLRLWWNDEKTVLHVRGELPDLLGAKVEATINDMVERARPAPGEGWEPRDRRAADAFGQLCDMQRGTADDLSPRPAAKPVLVVEVPQHGPAVVGGVALPDSVVEQLRANATIEPVLVDDQGVPVAIGRRTTPISPKKARSVLRRDGSCRCGCGLRHGLDIHHLVPRSWGGSDDVSNLAALFAPHHRQYIPHGPYALVGNPNVPSGLRTIVYADLTPEDARRYGLPPPTRRRRE